MTATRLNPTAAQQHVGDYYSAAWTATSASAFGDKLTGDMVLPAGVYVVTLSVPWMTSTGNPLMYINGLNERFFFSSSYATVTHVMKLTSQTNVYARHGASSTTTFDSQYLKRGGIEAVRIA